MTEVCVIVVSRSTAAAAAAAVVDVDDDADDIHCCLGMLYMTLRYIAGAFSSS